MDSPLFYRSVQSLRLLILILLPVAIAAGAMIWNTSRMLEGIATSVNTQEDHRSWQAVQSAFTANQQHLANLVTANAYSTETFQHTSGTIDRVWTGNTWGLATYEVNYDTVYVLDGGGNALVGYHDGAETSVPPQKYFGSGFASLLEALPKDGNTFLTEHSLAFTPNGLAIVAAGPILPNSGNVSSGRQPLHFLVFSRSVTPAMLADMGKQYQIDDLTVSPVADSKADDGRWLKDNCGRPVADVSWTIATPGDAARRMYSNTALFSVIMLLGAMVPLSITHAATLLRLKKNEADAIQKARTDKLSGLPNRLFFSEELARLLRSAPPRGLALCFIDLDDFKSVNDAYDHEAGDRLIVAVAAGISALLQPGDMLGRLGGDEFAALCTGDNAAQRAETLAAHILSFVSQPFNLDGRIANIGASIGIAVNDAGITDPSELMRRADLAMYDAKHSGRNRVRVFDDGLDARRAEDLAVSAELKVHIANRAFDIVYQPIIDARTRRVTGLEALARWPSSSARSVPPERFVKIAEEHGLIDALGQAILRTAMSDARYWNGLKLALNISPVQINNRNLLDSIVQTARELQFPLQRLEIELTENVLIRSKERARLLVKELRARGITVSLDDFGTGYASVGYLLEYGFNKIKIDKSLTHMALSDTNAQKIVQGTILIAKGLSTGITAEGIESEEQARIMHLAGCDQMQGFYFGGPVSALEINRLLSPPKPAQPSLTA